MKLLIQTCAAAILFVGLTGNAFSAMYEITYERPTATRITKSRAITWHFNMSGSGFDAALYDLATAAITINLSDDNDRSKEVVKVKIGGKTYKLRGSGSFTITPPTWVLRNLNNNQSVTIKLKGAKGDVLFDSAVLTVWDNSPEPEPVVTPLLALSDPPNSQENGENTQPNGAAPVPEPGTLILLGLGLAGLAGWRRFGK